MVLCYKKLSGEIIINVEINNGKPEMDCSLIPQFCVYKKYNFRQPRVKKSCKCNASDKIPKYHAATSTTTTSQMPNAPTSAGMKKCWKVKAI